MKELTLAQLKKKARKTPDGFELTLHAPLTGRLRVEVLEKPAKLSKKHVETLNCFLKIEPGKKSKVLHGMLFTSYWQKVKDQNSGRCLQAGQIPKIAVGPSLQTQTPLQLPLCTGPLGHGAALYFC
jgi:hypothetical protein